MEKVELIITNVDKQSESMDGVKWDEVTIKVDVTISSNEELSNLLNTIRFLRGGVPKK